MSAEVAAATEPLAPGGERAGDSGGGGTSYPVMLDLRGRRVLVVGGGRVAAGKVERLMPTGARITVVAPEVTAAIAGRPEVAWHARPYQRGEVASYRLAITATGDPAVDGRVHADGEAAGVWVNAADDVRHCAFTLPAVARSGPITISVATEGRSPALASWLRRRAESTLDAAIADLLDLLVATRAELRTATGTSEHPGWAPALDRGLDELIRQGRPDQAAEILRTHLGLPIHDVGAP